MSFRVSLRGMCWLIRGDTLRSVDTFGFILGRLICMKVLLSKRVEQKIKKGEISNYERSRLLSQCFFKTRCFFTWNIA